VFTPAIEYGLVPIEASAAGTPVIALGYGGVRETMVDVEEAQKLGTTPTAVFFYEQTAAALIDAIERFQAISFDRDALSAYAEQFSVEVFQQKLRAMVRAAVDE
jgi:glycosyltransferase involved in cell wall biosynthesis